MNNFTFSLNLIDLLENHKTSFHYFLKLSLQKLIKENFNSNFNFNLFKAKFLVDKMKFIFSKNKFSDILAYKSLNVLIGFYIPLKIIDKVSRKKIELPILMGNLPLLLEDGSFIIDGLSKIFSQSLILNTTVTFNKIITDVNKTTTISILGKDYDEITFELKQNLVENINSNFISVYKKDIEDNEFDLETLFQNDLLISRFEKEFPLQILASFYKIKKSDILFFIKDETWINKYFDKIDEISSKTSLNLISKIYDISSSLELNYFIKKLLFIDNECRFFLNKKLSIDSNYENNFLTKLDILKIIQKIYFLDKNRESVDDIDNLTNKKLVSIGEYLEHFTEIIIDEWNEYTTKTRFKQYLKKLYTKFLRKKRRIKIRYLNPFSKRFNDQIIEFLSLSDNSLIKEDTNPLTSISQQRKIIGNSDSSETITLDTRDIHPSFFTKICPIETPEGENSGLISTLTLLSLVDFYGSICTNLIKNKKNKISLKNESFYLNPLDETLNSIQLPNNLLNNNFEYKKTNLIRNNDIFYNNLKLKKHFNYLTSLQFFSASCLLIPFLEHNDANRILMGSNMQRQAVPLQVLEKPNIATGLETILSHSVESIKSFSQGFVSFVSFNKIIIETKNKQKIIYNLRKNVKTQAETIINYTPNVWIGENVYCGQIIANGYAIQEGELSLGKNLNVAYISWEGYNFEDSIIINEKLVLNNTLTSLHFELIEVELEEENILGKSSDIEKDSKSYTQIDYTGMCKIGTKVCKGDILLNIYSAKHILVDSNDNEIINESEEKNNRFVKTYKHTPFLSPVDGTIIDIRLKSPGTIKSLSGSIKTFNPKLIIKIYIANKRKIKVGDKLSGRFGNKGVISKILPEKDMPFFKDGTSIDIILNPLGIPSRMNIGQIYECLLGLCSKKINKRFKVFPFNENISKESTKNLVNNKIKEAFKNKDTLGFFDSNFSGKLFIRDGRTGEFFDNPVLAGNSYILKLFHLVDEKIHSRNIGPYSLITKQPTQGKPNKGGQRFGEMESWALEAYGAVFALNELFTLKSDDINNQDSYYKNQYIDKIQNLGYIPESLYTLKNDLNSLGMSFNITKFDFIGFFKSNYLLKNAAFTKNVDNLYILKDNLKQKKKLKTHYDDKWV